MLKKISRFQKAGLEQKNGKLLLFAAFSVSALLTAGCSNGSPEVSDTGAAAADDGEPSFDEWDLAGAERIAEICGDIYKEEAEMRSKNKAETSASGSLKTMRRIAERLGENGYAAVDSENQVDMAGSEQVIEFCKAVDKKKNDKITIVVILDCGFRKFDLETENGTVNIVRGYYRYDERGCLQNRSVVSYPADVWEYTEEGYLIFEGSYFSDEDFVLTLDDATEHTALRVLPLDEKCRELNRKYILSVGYRQNNIFLTDWSEEDFGDLDFYDIFDIFYPLLYEEPVPYAADENLGVGAVYQIPEDVFENVILSYFPIDRETLRQKTTYLLEEASYEYRPRGFYEAEYPDIPYPEAVSYTENPDGTITLVVHAVYPNGNDSMAYSHRTVIRPLNENCFQYVSNQMLPSFLSDGMEGGSSEDDSNIWWHSSRLTKEEWIETYGGTE